MGNLPKNGRSQRPSSRHEHTIDIMKRTFPGLTHSLEVITEATERLSYHYELEMNRSNKVNLWRMKISVEQLYRQLASNSLVASITSEIQGSIIIVMPESEIQFLTE